MTEIAPSETKRMPAYPEYKDSGVEWLKEIPIHWDVISLKYAADVIYDKIDDKPDGLPYIGLEHIESGTGRLIKEEEVDEVGSAVAHFKKGDVLFGKLRPYLAKVYKAENEGVGTTELIPLRPRADVSERYLAYELISEGFIDTVNALTYGVKMPRVSPDQLGAQKIAVPPLDEQRAIAAYLDRETERIDTLVAQKERLIELLQEKRTALISRAVTKGLDPDVEMQDSGVEWLGAIPAHWDIVRVKHLATRQQRGVQMGPFGAMLKNLESEDTGYKVYGQENIISGDFDKGSRWVSESRYEELAGRYELKPGDIVLTRKGSIGNCRIVPQSVQKGVADSDTIRLRLDWNRVHPSFLQLLLHDAWYLQTQIGLVKRGAVLSGLNTSTIENLLIALPPLDEQKHVVQWVREEAGTIDLLTGRVEDGIERLQEYRTALISAAVTGQIDVRDEVEV